MAFTLFNLRWSYFFLFCYTLETCFELFVILDNKKINQCNEEEIKSG